MKLKSVASLKGPLACSILLILNTYFLSLTAMVGTPVVSKKAAVVKAAEEMQAETRKARQF